VKRKYGEKGYVVASGIHLTISSQCECFGASLLRSLVKLCIEMTIERLKIAGMTNHQLMALTSSNIYDFEATVRNYYKSYLN